MPKNWKNRNKPKAAVVWANNMSQFWIVIPKKYMLIFFSVAMVRKNHQKKHNCKYSIMITYPDTEFY